MDFSPSKKRKIHFPAYCSLLIYSAIYENSGTACIFIDRPEKKAQFEYSYNFTLVFLHIIAPYIA